MSLDVLDQRTSRRQLVTLTGSEEAADEVVACREFLQLVNSLEADTLGVKHVGPYWLAWARGQISGTDVLAIEQPCVVCGCSDHEHPNPNAWWVVSGLCSSCAVPTGVAT